MLQNPTRRRRSPSSLAARLLPSALAVALVAAVDLPAHAAFPGDNGLIAFDSARDGNFEIYAMRPDGTGPQNLTRHPASDSDPAWSPDGQRLAFLSNRDGNGEIYVMNADGSGQTRLTNHPAADFEPAWSPDGAKLAFTTNRDGNLEVYVMNADGSGQTRLTNDTVE
jgi:Tol biopolymer transport system component